MLLRKKGESKVLVATPVDEHGSPLREAIAQISWRSSDSAVAPVANGTVTGLRSGEAEIRAEIGEVSGAARIQVSVPARVALSPDVAEIVGLGRTITISARVEDETGKEAIDPQIAWSTRSATVASVAGGVVEGRGIGTTWIQAIAGGVVATSTVVVRFPRVKTIDVMPLTRELAKPGDAVRLIAIPKDDEGQVIRGIVVGWSTSSPSIATVTHEGLVQAVRRGKARIKVSAEGTFSEIEIIVR